MQRKEENGRMTVVVRKKRRAVARLEAVRVLSVADEDGVLEEGLLVALLLVLSMFGLVLLGEVVEVGGSLDELGLLLRGQVAHKLSRRARPQLVGGDGLAAGDNRARGDDSSVSDDGVIEDDRATSDARS